MELKEIQNLIKFVAKSGVNEVHVEMGETKVTIKTGGDVVQQVVTTPAAIEAAPAPAPVATPSTPSTPAEPAPAAAERQKTIITLRSNRRSSVPFIANHLPTNQILQRLAIRSAKVRSFVW